MPNLRQKIIARILHFYPFYSGCGTIGNSLWIRKIAGESDEIVWTRLPNGKYIRASLSDFDGRAVFYTGDCDRKITWLCQKLVRPGDVALDIGANIGLVTFTLASIVGEAGYVHAFEPNPQMQHLITEALEYNRVTNVMLHPFALGAEDATLEMRIPIDHSGSASLIKKFKQNVTNILVPVKPLSSVLSDIESKKIRFVKIDVEGFEPQVLQGAYDAFYNNPPDIILVELHSSSHLVDKHPTVKILRKLGYDFFSIPKSLMSVKPRYFDPEKSQYIGHDLLAAQQGEISKEVAALVGATN
ncbi:FkbM family methyltransferase [Coleofasciculus chthonoplastes]|uniref:FkbM family methyltransferase n=1 Tax=Coleofasciculus chthonoplastes TaxID=64178 RepID=UPI003302693F